MLRTNFVKAGLGIGGLLALGAATLPPAALPVQPDATPAQVSLHRLQQDLKVAEILQALKARAPHQPVLFRNVQLVDPAAGSLTAGQSVIVSGRRITWVGRVTTEPKLPDPVIVDGSDRYLSPALVDMHVHTNNQGDWLLDLAAGVTTVREMAGFPWMLKAREAVNADRMLAPTSYVAGPLINADPLEGYAVVPIDAADARRMVRQEAACGYDFIKVHNILPEPLFDAVAEQARALDIDLIGHVPHDITVRHAVQRGMRSMEHLTGFLNDATLQLGDTDYAAAVDGPEVWNTPTLYAGLAPPRGEAGRVRLGSPEMRYAALRKRQAWARELGEPEDPSLVALRDSRRIQLQIVAQLNAEHARFLAGTDSANFPFQIRGFALLDELGLLQEAGLTPLQAMRAATTEPARALRAPDGFGEIRTGLRADLALLDADPLRDTAAFRRSRGVMAHGCWLDRASLDKALDQLATVYAEEDAHAALDPSALLERLEALSSAGVVVNASEIKAAAEALRSAGKGEFADRLAALAYDPPSGPCAEYRPR
jgi:imidazolonepropionase-like amidohydrolase